MSTTWQALRVIEHLREPNTAAVLFDLDGSLIDTAPDLAAALNEVLDQDGLPAMPYEQIRAYVSTGAVGLIKLAYGLEPGSADYDKRRQRFLDAYRAGVADRSRLFEGIERVLRTIEQSDRQWGIVTNKPEWLTKPLLDALALAHRSGCVIAGDSASHPKPHPAPLLMAAERLDLDPYQCLYIGDAERDVVAARAAGMRVVVANYGYFAPHDDPTNWDADGAIDHPLDLLDWL